MPSDLRSEPQASGETLPLSKGPHARMHGGLGKLAPNCFCCLFFGFFGIVWVGGGGGGAGSRTSSQISDILVKSSYGDVGQISSLETRDGGFVREGTRDQM